MSILCNLNLNLTMYDPRLHKVTEFATDVEFKLQDLLPKRMNNGGHQASDQPKTSKHVKYKLVNALE